MPATESKNHQWRPEPQRGDNGRRAARVRANRRSVEREQDERQRALIAETIEQGFQRMHVIVEVGYRRPCRGRNGCRQAVVVAERAGWICMTRPSFRLISHLRRIARKQFGVRIRDIARDDAAKQSLRGRRREIGGRRARMPWSVAVAPWRLEKGAPLAMGAR